MQHVLYSMKQKVIEHVLYSMKQKVIEFTDSILYDNFTLIESLNI